MKLMNRGLALLLSLALALPSLPVYASDLAAGGDDTTTPQIEIVNEDVDDELVDEPNLTQEDEGGDDIIPPAEGGEELTPPAEGEEELTPPAEGGEEVTPPAEGGEDTTPPEEGGEDTTPPSEGGEELTPPAEGGEELTPPAEGGDEVTPPAEGGDEVTPPAEGGDELTPPADGGDEVTPPAEGGEELTPPAEGGDEVTPPEEGGDDTTPPTDDEEADAEDTDTSDKENAEDTDTSDKEDAEDTDASDKEDAEDTDASDKEDAEDTDASDKEDAEDTEDTDTSDKEDEEDKDASDKEDEEDKDASDKEDEEDKDASDKEDGKDKDASDKKDDEEKKAEDEIEKLNAEAEDEEERIIPDRTEKVIFNTGNHEFTIVDNAVNEDLVGDGAFDEDGNFTINIPESNPFFPYEVEFTCDGEVTTEWFMTPDDYVEIGGHTFYVSAYFDGTVVTQMSLNVAGKDVIVYPQAKEFTNDGSGVMEASLLPLTEKDLTVNLEGFTPLELSMVAMTDVFTGENQLQATDKIVWNYFGGDNYTISLPGDKLDFGVRANNGTWEIIVGEDDQLAADNMRYRISVVTTDYSDWLTAEVYSQNEQNVRKKIFINNSNYNGNSSIKKYATLRLCENTTNNREEVYLGLKLNTEVFSSVGYSAVKFYEGSHATAEEAMAATEITNQIWNVNMSQKNAGYLYKTRSSYNYENISMVAFDSAGKVIGFLPIELRVNWEENFIYSNWCIYNDAQENVVWDEDVEEFDDGDSNILYTLYKGYAANEQYAVGFDYYTYSNYEVTAAYQGKYNSISEAAASGAEDIKESLMGAGYTADYSKGIDFTFFVGADDYEFQEIYHINVKIEEGGVEKNTNAPDYPDYPEILNGGTDAYFWGLRDKDGEYIEEYRVSSSNDSYGEKNYIIYMVEKNININELALLFDFNYGSEGAKLYSSGSATPEVSGETLHDYSNGAVQFTVVSEDGKNSKNYWVHVLQNNSENGQLWINSLDAEESETKVVDGVIYSKREMMLDSYHDNKHEIFVANKGLDSIEKLSVELTSDVLVLDEYWTLKGEHELSGMENVDTSDYKYQPNIAKVRIKAKEGVESTDVSGTLTFKSGDKTLMVLELTGIIGDPSMITKEIPQAVKYVPYGSVIQNNNKYSWNSVEYEFLDGELPEGMEVKENGEIYGVPTESGEFTFTVKMDNSSYEFEDDVKTYTLVVQDNTDVNVDKATDEGYTLSQKVEDIKLTGSAKDGKQTLVSEGVFGEFVDIYLDGEKLEKDTDYTAESGSTRITIMNQTLTEGGIGTHTLGIEFRTTDSDTLKRAAQNYEVIDPNQKPEVKPEDKPGITPDNTPDNIPEDFWNDLGNNVGNNSDNNSDKDEWNNSQDNYTDNSWYAYEESPSTPTNNFAALAAELKENAAKNQETVTGTVSYTIQPGDTLWKIAVKYFGDGNAWRKILELNKATITNPDMIYVGQVITINVASNGNTANTSAVNTAADDTAAINAEDGTYTVQAGDTMWKISKKLYGTGIFWRRLFNANKDTIADASRIYAGQTIKIPN